MTRRLRIALALLVCMLLLLLLLWSARDRRSGGGESGEGDAGAPGDGGGAGAAAPELPGEVRVVHLEVRLDDTLPPSMIIEEHAPDPVDGITVGEDTLGGLRAALIQLSEMGAPPPVESTDDDVLIELESATGAMSAAWIELDAENPAEVAFVVVVDLLYEGEGRDGQQRRVIASREPGSAPSFGTAPTYSVSEAFYPGELTDAVPWPDDLSWSFGAQDVLSVQVDGATVAIAPGESAELAPIEARAAVTLGVLGDEFIEEDPDAPPFPETSWHEIGEVTFRSRITVHNRGRLRLEE
jgi:hypothetical protein